MMATNDLTVYVAGVDGQAVGTAAVITMPNLTYGCAPTAFVEAVVVDVGYRRKGIATQMMRRISSDTRSAGCYKVHLLSHKPQSHGG